MAHDLRCFIENNALWKTQKRRVPWEQRLKLIEEEFPAIQDAEWHLILRDPDILARVIKDILKVDQIEPGRAGPRPNLDIDRGMRTWREMTVGDYSELSFPQAFRVLARNNSVRSIARKTNISKSRVERLLLSQEHPTIDDLRLIAAAYQKKPAYFVEYRTEYIMAAIASALTEAHEMTVTLYRKLIQPQ